MPERAELERRAAELLRQLIRFNTVNPPGEEAALQEFLRELLEAAGFDCELLAAVEGRPNLIARLPAGSDGPTLCLLGHVDTVLADASQWTVDPWAGELRDDCVWGRGAIDMKSQVAAEAAAAIALAEEGWRPQAGELLLVFTCDEETGAVAGAQWLCREHPDKVRADLVVNEGAGQVLRRDGRRVYGVCLGEKGVFRFQLTTSGRAGHASVPRIGDNALGRMGPVLTALRDRRAPADPPPESLRLLERPRPRCLRPGGRPARAERGRSRAGRPHRAAAGRELRADHHACGRQDQRDTGPRRAARSTAGCRPDRGRSMCARRCGP